MPDKLIINASPLIFLHRVGGWPWLCKSSATDVLIPSAVLQEVCAGWDGEEIADAIQSERRMILADDLEV